MDSMLIIKEVSKTFPGVRALDNVSFSIQKGRVHALVGENGAGKSTLIKIISGAQESDSGSILLDGTELINQTPAFAKQNGLGVIYQEISLVPSLSVLENIFMGNTEYGKIGPNKKLQRKKAQEVFASLGININLDAPINTLPIAKQQLVEIAREISRNVKVLIMDEPSAVLDVDGVRHLFRIINKLKEKGVSIVYISHRMDEIFEIADDITVLRDGKHIETTTMEGMTQKKIIALMVGRELKESFPKRNVARGETILQLKNVTGNGDADISFELHKGEILGLAGLVGAGRTEIAKVIIGAVPKLTGEILLYGKPVNFTNPSQSASAGIALIPEDRKVEGAFLDYSINWNISMMALKHFSKYSLINKAKVEEQVLSLSKQLRIKTPNLNQLVRNLSGGNQQKVVVAKALAAEAKIVIFDEPTRGIDVGSKQEIYSIMNNMVESGISIIMISSEMEELIGMSDNVVVLHEGHVSGYLTHDQLSQQRILELASGM